MSVRFLAKLIRSNRSVALPLIVVGLLVGSTVESVAIAPISIPAATAPARVQQKQEKMQEVIPENYDLRLHPILDSNTKHWRNILWTTAIVEPKAPYVAQALDQILTLATRPGLSDPQQGILKAAFQVGIQLYLTGDPNYANLRSRWIDTLTQSQDAEWVALSLGALRQGGATASELQPWMTQVQQRFPNWVHDPLLFSTIREIELALYPAQTPPLQDLLAWEIAPNQPHLFVICQPDRRILCTTVLRDRNGQFLREPVATTTPSEPPLWSVPLLLESIHKLDWNFTRGRTPQGIYRIEGVVPQPDLDFFRAYGQFDLVQMFAPHEPGVKGFLPGKLGTLATLSAYQALLPPSWRNYFPIQQSYWAGKIGRGLFRIHGSGEANNFFQGKVAVPEAWDWNPTLGCLSAIETYDDRGRLQQADMPKILNTLRQIGGANFTGYVVVVDVPSASPTPFSLAQLENLIRDRNPVVQQQTSQSSSL